MPAASTRSGVSDAVEHRAIAGLAVDRDRAVMVVHNAMHHRQAQARALAGRRQREGRLENPPPRRLIHGHPAALMDTRAQTPGRSQSCVAACGASTRLEGIETAAQGRSRVGGPRGRGLGALATARLSSRARPSSPRTSARCSERGGLFTHLTLAVASR